MEIQLNEIIERIKKDAVEAAEAEAESIVNLAKSEAEKIIFDAKSQAERIISEAKTEQVRVVASGEDAIRQAGRNLLISFRQSVAKQVDAIAAQHVATAYSGENLSSLILTAVERWINNTEADSITVLLSSDELAQLEGGLTDALNSKFASGVTLKASDSFDGGFRIAANNSGIYYDYSREAVINLLSNYLSPKVTALLKEAE